MPLGVPHEQAPQIVASEAPDEEAVVKALEFLDDLGSHRNYWAFLPQGPSAPTSMPASSKS